MLSVFNFYDGCSWDHPNVSLPPKKHSAPTPQHKVAIEKKIVLACVFCPASEGWISDLQK